MTRPRHLTVAAVADELDVSPRTVLRYIHGGNLTAVQLPGGKWRVSEAELSRFLAAGTTSTVNPSTQSGRGDAVNAPRPDTGGKSDAT